MTHSIEEQLIFLLFLVFGLLCTPLLFIALDFWAGIRKARVRRERIRSDKMQRTVRKISRYYNAILAMVVLDAVQISGFVFLHYFNGWSLYTFPLFTGLSVAFTAAIEVKSIIEPADEKESREMREVNELAIAIAKHKSDPNEIASAIIDYMNKSKEEEKQL